MHSSAQTTEESSNFRQSTLHSIEDSINELKQENSVHSWLPKFFNGIIRRQGVVNKFIITVFERLYREFNRLNEYTKALKSDLGTLEEKLRREFQQDLAILETSLSKELQQRSKSLLANVEIERLQREKDQEIIHSHLGALLSSTCVFDKQIIQIIESLSNIQKDINKDRRIVSTQLGEKQKIIDELKEKIYLLGEHHNLYIKETRPIFKKLGQNISDLETNQTQSLSKLDILKKKRTVLEPLLKAN